MRLIKKILIKIFIFILFVAPFISFVEVHAQVGGSSSSGETTTEGVGVLKNPLAGVADNIPELIEKILGIAVTIGVPVIVLMIIYTGFLFVAAQGNPDKLRDAKSKLRWVLIGAAILLGAWVIASAIQATVDSITTAVS